MFITRDYTLSIMAYWIAVFLIISLFAALDDKDNGVLNKMKYIKVALIVLIIWTIITHLFVFYNLPNDADPLIAPVIRIIWT